MRISDLPPGSIRLKSYNGRSFFNGLLSDPATRKRANVLEVLEGFPESKFILIGDTGEQDLELYANIASERPDQVLAVFIRDVRDVALVDPTGSQAASYGPSLAPRRSQTKKMSLPPSFASFASGRPPPHRTLSDMDGMIDSGAGTAMKRGPPTKKFTLQSFASLDSSGSVSDVDYRARMSVESMSSTGSSSSLSLRNLRRATAVPLTEAEKKRVELQTRVNKARSMMRRDIILRVFKHPLECTETDRLLEQMKDRNRKPT